MTLHFEGKRLPEGRLTEASYPNQSLEDTVRKLLLDAITVRTHSKYWLESMC